MLPMVVPLMENCSKAGDVTFTDATQVEKLYTVLGSTVMVWHHTDVLGEPIPFTTIKLLPELGAPKKLPWYVLGLLPMA